MPKACSHRKISLAYPKHLPAPEDLLHFIESTRFTDVWSELGLDDEDDLESLQLCIMVHPDGDRVVEGTNGLRIHRHYLHRPSGVRAITTYYSYFPDYGVVYLNRIVAGVERIRFITGDARLINESIANVEQELERLKTIRVRRRAAANKDGGLLNE